MVGVHFVRREEIAPGIWEYFFTSERPIDFVPGQYVDVFLDGITADPRGSSRVFTLTSLPDDAEFSFITKHFDVQSPYKWKLFHLKSGESGHIHDAMGDLVLPKMKVMPLVFVANGIGIASYVSMLKEMRLKNESRPVNLFYALLDRREQICGDLTDGIPFVKKEIVIKPNRITAEAIKHAVPADSLYYLSGSQNFVEKLSSDLESFGVPRSRIVFDYFDGYADL